MSVSKRKREAPHQEDRQQVRDTALDGVSAARVVLTGVPHSGATLESEL